MAPDALLARLLSMGGEAQYIAPDTLRVRWPGDPDPELRDALKAKKPEIIAYLRSTLQARPVACIGCGKVFFAEPRLCFWCAPGRPKPFTTDSTPATIRYSGNSMPHRPCSTCGGGLHHEDPDNGQCHSCRPLRPLLRREEERHGD